MVSLWLQFCWSPILTSCISLPTHFGDAQKGLLPSPPYTTIGPGFLLALYLKMQHPRQYHLHNWIGCRLKPLFLWPVVAVILNSRQDIFFLGNEEFLYSSSANPNTRVNHGITTTFKDTCMLDKQSSGGAAAGLFPKPVGRLIKMGWIRRTICYRKWTLHN